MKSLFASLGLAVVCMSARGAEPVPVIELPGLAQEGGAPTVVAASWPDPIPVQPVPEPGAVPMLAVGVVIVALRLGRKRRNDTFK